MPGNNGYCSPMSSTYSGWDMCMTKHGLTLGKKLRHARSRSQPRNKLRLARARPRLPSLMNPAEDHSFNCVLHNCESRRRLNHSLGQTSTSPKHGFDLDITNERTTDVTRSNRAKVLPRAFRHTRHCSNHYDLDNFPIR
jgi:hypothetical protein